MSGQISAAGSRLGDLGRVVVLYGGWSGEREVSLKGGTAVLGALQKAGIDAVGLDADRGWLGRLQALAPDRVFVMLHGRGGEDGQVQGALETLGLPYTGTGVLQTGHSAGTHPDPSAVGSQSNSSQASSTSSCPSTQVSD